MTALFFHRIKFYHKKIIKSSYFSKSKIGFTGHREVKNTEYVRERLREECLKAIKNGADTFISGFAEGTDLIFADIVVNLKKEFPHISLEAAIPYRGRLKTKDTEFNRLLKECSKVYVALEEYRKDCFFVRNRYIVDESILFSPFMTAEKEAEHITL